ncbi:ATP-dependent DNA helicase PIF1-like protein [Tanacetum coccineum]
MENHRTIRRHHQVTNISNNIRGDKENIAPEASQFSQPLSPYYFRSIPIMDTISGPSRDTTSMVSNPTEARMLRKIIMNNKGQYIKRKGSAESTPRVINPSIKQNSHKYSLSKSNSNAKFAAKLSNESLSTLHEIHGTQHSVSNNALEARKRRRLIINNKKAKDGCVELPNITQQPNLRGLSIVESQRLSFLRREQKNLRCASYSKLSSAVNNGETSLSRLGKKVYLPSSYTGGARRRDDGRTVTKSGTELDNRTPPVERLPFHLQGEQSVFFDEGSCIEDIVNNPSVNETMFTEWMEANKIYNEAKELTYVQFPTQIVCEGSIKNCG